MDHSQHPPVPYVEDRYIPSVDSDEMHEVESGPEYVGKLVMEALIKITDNDALKRFIDIEMWYNKK